MKIEIEFPVHSDVEELHGAKLTPVEYVTLYEKVSETMREHCLHDEIEYHIGDLEDQREEEAKK